MRTMTPLTLALLSTFVFAAPHKVGNSTEDECASSPLKPDLKLAAFTQALLWALEPAPTEIRVLAIEDLGLLGNPAALNVLAQLSTDLNPTIAKAGIKAVGSIRHPRAEEILSNILRHPSLPESSKIEALQRLPFQNTWSAIRTINQLARNISGTSYALNTQLRQLASTLPAPPPFDQSTGAP
jgi:HEAT repeat protein